MTKNSRQLARKPRENGKATTFGNSQRPRIVVSKSNRYLTLQAIDDTSQKTLVYLCSREVSHGGQDKQQNLTYNYKSKDAASRLGMEFARKLSARNIQTVVFDRNGYIYHGKIEILCRRMREQGIVF